MSSIADLSALVNRGTGGNSGTPQPIFVYKDARVNGGAAAAPIAARWTSFWRYEGIPSHGAVPAVTPGAIPTNATDGAFKQASPGGGRQQWNTLQVAAGQAGLLMVYDRLYHVSGMDGTVLTAQPAGGSVDRYTGTAAKGTEVWLEIYTQIGASSTTATVSYTDQDGNAGVTSPATPIGNTGLREAERIIRVPFATGDTGVRAVASVTLAATTGTAGNFGVTIARPLAHIPIPLQGLGGMISLLDAPAEWISAACLALAFFPQGTTAPQTSFFSFALES